MSPSTLRQKQDKYETIVWVPGIGRWSSGGEFTVESYHDMVYVADLPKSGRIVCHPCFEDLGSQIKKHALLPTGHNPPAKDVFREMDTWLRQLFSAESSPSRRAVDRRLDRR